MHSKMRIVVSLLVAFATVIHFTFGCCLHISHAGAGHTCGLGSSHAAEVQHAAQAQEDCDCLVAPEWEQVFRDGAARMLTRLMGE
jgi:hypothetical protein